MEWKEVRLGDVVEIVNGFAFKSKAFTLEGIPVIKIKNIKAGKVILNDLDYISTSDINPKYTKIRSSDILITMTGNRMDGSPETWVGKVSLFRHQGDFYLNQRVSALRLIDDSVDNNFLSYYLSSWQSQLYFALNSNSSGGQANITPAVVQEYRLMVPELETQRSIASILSSLDRKIELNNKINDDLEEMAQAIFKNWFVDFEPFKDGKFVDSELGMIPEGWKVVTLDDLTSKFGTGLNPRKNFVLGHGNNYYVTIKNMGNNRIYLNDRCDKVDDEALAKINKRSKLQKGDLLFSGIGTIGRVAMIVDDPINWNTSESVFNMHPIDTVSSEFIYLLLLSDKFQQYVQQNAQGGVQQGIRMASLKAFQFAIPDDLNLFDNLVKPIISKVKSNDKENDTLSLLRDTLLPRLMSGELEVPE